MSYYKRALEIDHGQDPELAGRQRGDFQNHRQVQAVLPGKSSPRRGDGRPPPEARYDKARYFMQPWRSRSVARQGSPRARRTCSGVCGDAELQGGDSPRQTGITGRADEITTHNPGHGTRKRFRATSDSRRPSDSLFAHASIGGARF